VLRGRDTVTLYVAGTTFPLPNLVGLEQTSAEQRIRDAQLKLMLVPEWDSTATLGTVLATDPAAGVDVSRGASVSLVVAMQGGWAWIKRTQLPDDYRDRHMRWQSTTNLRDAPSGNRIGSQTVRGGDSVRVLEIQRFPATGSWVKVVVFWSPPGR
jgi:serine/threonine-protein kinase